MEPAVCDFVTASYGDDASDTSLDVYVDCDDIQQRQQQSNYNNNDNGGTALFLSSPKSKNVNEDDRHYNVGEDLSSIGFALDNSTEIFQTCILNATEFTFLNSLEVGNDHSSSNDLLLDDSCDYLSVHELSVHEEGDETILKSIDMGQNTSTDKSPPKAVHRNDVVENVSVQSDSTCVTEKCVKNQVFDHLYAADSGLGSVSVTERDQSLKFDPENLPTHLSFAENGCDSVSADENSNSKGLVLPNSSQSLVHKGDETTPGSIDIGQNTSAEKSLAKAVHRNDNVKNASVTSDTKCVQEKDCSQNQVFNILDVVSDGGIVLASVSGNGVTERDDSSKSDANTLSSQLSFTENDCNSASTDGSLNSKVSVAPDLSQSLITDFDPGSAVSPSSGYLSDSLNATENMSDISLLSEKISKISIKEEDGDTAVETLTSSKEIRNPFLHVSPRDPDETPKIMGNENLVNFNLDKDIKGTGSSAFNNAVNEQESNVKIPSEATPVDGGASNESDGCAMSENHILGNGENQTLGNCGTPENYTGSGSCELNLDNEIEVGNDGWNCSFSVFEKNYSSNKNEETKDSVGAANTWVGRPSVVSCFDPLFTVDKSKEDEKSPPDSSECGANSAETIKEPKTSIPEPALCKVPTTEEPEMPETLIFMTPKKKSSLDSTEQELSPFVATDFEDIVANNMQMGNESLFAFQTPPRPEPRKIQRQGKESLVRNIFASPSSFDYLMKAGNTTNNSVDASVGRPSVITKFDPLLAKYDELCSETKNSDSNSGGNYEFHIPEDVPMSTPVKMEDDCEDNNDENDQTAVSFDCTVVAREGIDVDSSLNDTMINNNPEKVLFSPFNSSISAKNYCQVESDSLADTLNTAAVDNGIDKLLSAMDPQNVNHLINCESASHQSEVIFPESETGVPPVHARISKQCFSNLDAASATELSSENISSTHESDAILDTTVIPSRDGEIGKNLQSDSDCCATDKEPPVVAAANISRNCTDVVETLTRILSLLDISAEKALGATADVGERLASSGHVVTEQIVTEIIKDIVDTVSDVPSATPVDGILQEKLMDDSQCSELLSECKEMKSVSEEHVNRKASVDEFSPAKALFSEKNITDSIPKYSNDGAYSGSEIATDLNLDSFEGSSDAKEQNAAVFHSPDSSQECGVSPAFILSPSSFDILMNSDGSDQKDLLQEGRPSVISNFDPLLVEDTEQCTMSVAECDDASDRHERDPFDINFFETDGGNFGWQDACLFARNAFEGGADLAFDAAKIDKIANLLESKQSGTVAGGFPSSEQESLINIAKEVEVPEGNDCSDKDYSLAGSLSTEYNKICDNTVVMMNAETGSSCGTITEKDYQTLLNDNEKRLIQLLDDSQKKQTASIEAARENIEKLVRQKELLVNTYADASSAIMECLEVFGEVLANHKSEVAEILHRRKESMCDRDRCLEDVQNVEKAFSELMVRYEKSKAVLEKMKGNETVFKQQLEEDESQIARNKEKYEELQRRAEMEIGEKNDELRSCKNEYEVEKTKLQALIQRNELKIRTLSMTLENTTKGNSDLQRMIDEIQMAK